MFISQVWVWCSRSNGCLATGSTKPDSAKWVSSVHFITSFISLLYISHFIQNYLRVFVRVEVHGKMNQTHCRVHIQIPCPSGIASAGSNTPTLPPQAAFCSKIPLKPLMGGSLERQKQTMWTSLPLKWYMLVAIAIKTIQAYIRGKLSTSRYLTILRKTQIRWKTRIFSNWYGIVLYGCVCSSQGVCANPKGSYSTQCYYQTVNGGCTFTPSSSSGFESCPSNQPCSVMVDVDLDGEVTW